MVAPGLPHHVTQRGNRRQETFFSEADYRSYLALIAEHYAGGPVGVETLAAALSEQRDAIEDVIEPFLIQQGLLMRTPRGRVLTPASFQHLGLTLPSEIAEQLDLLAAENAGEADHD